jgi:DNA-directed RNA polymerase specialized sigma24 family protein
VRRLLEELPAGERAALEAAFFDELPYRAAAQSLGQPEGTFKWRVRAGLQHLRSEFEEPNTVVRPTPALDSSSSH